MAKGTIHGGFALSAHPINETTSVITLLRCPALSCPDYAALSRQTPDSTQVGCDASPIAHSIYHPSLPCGQNGVPIIYTASSPPGCRTAPFHAASEQRFGPHSIFKAVYEIPETLWHYLLFQKFGAYVQLNSSNHIRGPRTFV